METKLTPAKLKELESTPRLNWRDLLNIKGELTPEDIQALDKYFSHFVHPDPTGKCLNCGLVQDGLMAALLGGFRWGLAHGEGFCSRCQYPARAYHFSVGPIERLNVLLQYHPLEVKI